VSEGKAEALSNILKNKGKETDLNDYMYLDGWTLLHHAVSMKSFNVAEVLITHGCDVNLQTESMRSTPLHLAVLGRQTEIVELLLEYKASPNLVDIDFCTPLHYAAEMGFVEVAKAILEGQGHPINFALRNNKKMTPADCCRDLRIRRLMLEYCEKYQCPLEESNYQKRTFDAGGGRTFITRTRCDFV
jgi:hypothetical protein